MAISFVGYSLLNAQTTADATASVTLVSGTIAEDDLMIIHVLGAGNGTHVAPSGWAAISPSVLRTTNASTVDDVSTQAYYKIAGASESDVTVPSIGDETYTYLAAFRTDGTGPLEVDVVVGDVESTASTSHSHPGLTTTQDDSMICTLICAGDNVTVFNQANASVDSVATMGYQRSNVGNDYTCDLGYGNLASTGATGAWTFGTGASEKTCAIMFSIIEAAAGSSVSPSGTQTLGRQSTPVAASKLGGVIQ